MVRKKKASQPKIATASPPLPAPSPAPSPSSTADPARQGVRHKSAIASPSSSVPASALIICRNKHWRYISSFHGPWLQLPPEVLESLAHSNHVSPRPRPIHPGVFYDLVKIRKAVDDATSLTVRATSGLTSAALGSSLVAGTAALGIAYPATGTGKLSRERKHRVRELATSKLSQAFCLDEIAASVATMQSASALEDVAHLVLQREPANVDAQYVHFFHEKIPSRMMAQSTSLDTLSRIIVERPRDASPLRTRALTRILKHDYVNAARDLDEALRVARYATAQHRESREQVALAKTGQDQHGRDVRYEAKVCDEDQPSSLETQLLFHRADVYLTIACTHIHVALDGLREGQEAKANRPTRTTGSSLPDPEPGEDSEGNRCRAEARKQVRQNAKRALRDYLAFLSHIEYTPGISAELGKELSRRSENNPHSHALAAEDVGLDPNLLIASSTSHPSWPKLPSHPAVFNASQFFQASPPASLPTYPVTTPTAPAAAAAAFADAHEIITYHPLLIDALHSLLLCHALIQTPSKEHLRHAHNAARLVRACDGYPLFLSARSPALADWIEVLDRTENWIGLSTYWESLCQPAPLPSHGKSSTGSVLSRDDGLHGAGDSATTAEADTHKRDCRKHEAILEALTDEHVIDEDSFQRVVRVHEQRLGEEGAEGHASSFGAPSHLTPISFSSPSPSSSRSSSRPKSPSSPATSRPWAQDDGCDYPDSTERARAISRWVREAPHLTDSSGTSRKRAKGKGKGKGKKMGLPRAASAEPGVAESVETRGMGEEEMNEHDGKTA